MPDFWSMVQCAGCQSIWLDPRPDTSSLPRAYDHYYTHTAEADEALRTGDVPGLAWQLVHGYLNRRFGMRREPANTWGFLTFSLAEPWRLKLDYYGRHLTRRRVGAPGRLLDIGCGNGGFLARAQEMGWQVIGCEVDPKAVAVCRSLGLEVIEGDAFAADLERGSFDAITVSHVIEHVDDPAALLRRAYELLRPGGWLWLACPNPQSIGLGVCGAAWHALHPPYHLCIPSRAILSRWLAEAGFLRMRFLRRGAHVRSVWRTSQLIADRERIAVPSAGMRWGWRLLADIVSTLISGRAEETVAMARKPG